MKYLILFLFIVLSGCKSEKDINELEAEPKLLGCGNCYYDNWQICDSYTKKIDNNERLIACYNVALEKKMYLDERLKHPELSPYIQVNDYLHYGIRTCFNTLFKKDSIKYFCEDFEKHYDSICKIKGYSNNCYFFLEYKLKNDN